MIGIWINDLNGLLFSGRGAYFTIYIKRLLGKLFIHFVSVNVRGVWMID